MTTEYDAAMALEHTGETTFDTRIDSGWFVTGPNGGYLAAMMLMAARSAPTLAGRPARSMTVHYLQPGAEGPATIDVEVTRAGRSLAFATIRLQQDSRLVAQAMAVLGSGRSDVEFQDIRPVDVSPPEELGPPQIHPALLPPFTARFDYRPVEDVPMFGGDRADVWCWLRLAQQRPVDDSVLALMVDALPPAMYFRKGAPQVFPTVDLTVHLRNPVPEDHDGWCLGHVATRTAASGFVEEDCDLYDRSGTLLAQGRQLALMVPMG